jgi:aspartokinase
MKFLDVTLEAREEEEQKVIKKPVYDWRYENNINSEKTLIDLDLPLEFKYNQWRTNLSLSNHTDTIAAANEMNTNYHLSDKLHYQYLFYKVRKQKRYGKKKTEEDKKREKEAEKEQNLIALISSHYKYNSNRAKEVLSILTKEQIDIIKKRQEKGG